jgi:hypothetical protein
MRYKKKMNDSLANCIICGKFFKKIRCTHSCCSRKCRSREENKKISLKNEAKKQNIPCQICGKEFKPWGMRRKNCSKECSHQALLKATRLRYGRDSADKILSDTKGVCPCGKEFSKTTATYNKQHSIKYQTIRTLKKYCSDSCRSFFNSERQHTKVSEVNKREVEKKLGKMVTCPWCEKEFNRLERQGYGVIKFCTNECRDSYNQTIWSIINQSGVTITKEQISQDRFENQKVLLEAKRVWKRVTGKNFAPRL